jgi:uncharacterized protein
MAHYAAFLRMERPELNQEYRTSHLEYLETLDRKGKIYAKGRFTDGSGGLVVYICESLEEATELAQADPYIIHGVRILELHEWEV